ncbi:hypothetical protein B0H21DRAFT_721816 [Amylocystis lapponica]|nr:hypothetical protein B0H21DRAFT_721816 [Amylocystis lapponica]
MSCTNANISSRTVLSLYLPRHDCPSRLRPAPCASAPRPARRGIPIVKAARVPLHAQHLRQRASSSCRQRGSTPSALTSERQSPKTLGANVGDGQNHVPRPCVRGKFGGPEGSEGRTPAIERRALLLEQRRRCRHRRHQQTMDKFWVESGPGDDDGSCVTRRGRLRLKYTLARHIALRSTLRLSFRRRAASVDVETPWPMLSSREPIEPVWHEDDASDMPDADPAPARCIPGESTVPTRWLTPPVPRAGKDVERECIASETTKWTCRAASAQWMGVGRGKKAA